MTVIIGSDHAGYKTKEAVKKALAVEGHTVVDVGPFTDKKSVDYPDYADLVANDVNNIKDAKGVLVCGSGTGMNIRANRHKGIRAAMVYDTYSAKMARHDNDANVVTLRGRGVPQKDAIRFAKLFLKTPFSGVARHKRRIKKLDK